MWTCTWICTVLSWACVFVQGWCGQHLAEQGIHLHLCLHTTGQCSLHSNYKAGGSSQHSQLPTYCLSYVIVHSLFYNDSSATLLSPKLELVWIAVVFGIKKLKNHTAWYFKNRQLKNETHTQEIKKEGGVYCVECVFFKIWLKIYWSQHCANGNKMKPFLCLMTAHKICRVMFPLLYCRRMRSLWTRCASWTKAAHGLSLHQMTWPLPSGT